jgi:hypothetical protein
MPNFTVNALKGDVFGPNAAELAALKSKKTPTGKRRIVGVVQAAMPESSKLGDYYRLLGVFRAKLPNGDVYESTELILPRRAERLVVGRYREASAEERQKGIPFTLDLWCEHDVEGDEGKRGTPTGYGWRHATPETDGLASRLPSL